MPTPAFDLQGHRGARGLRPENTLPSFEAALDAGATSIETDLHLTNDDALVLVHDAILSEQFCTLLPGIAGHSPTDRPSIGTLTLADLRGYRADRNPDPQRFPNQASAVTPVAAAFAQQRGIDPYTLPTLGELFAFVAFYGGEGGAVAGKTDLQRARARQLHFDLELKRTPFRPNRIGDGFDGEAPAKLEIKTVETVRRTGLLERTTVRSFDHRSVRAIKNLEPRLRTGVLIANTAPVDPVRVAHDANAELYCPDVHFLDERQVRQLHEAGIAVLPWTVNDADDWQRLLSWGVDGITTDYPDRLAYLLRQHGITF